MFAVPACWEVERDVATAVAGGAGGAGGDVDQVAADGGASGLVFRALIVIASQAFPAHAGSFIAGVNEEATGEYERLLRSM